MQAQSAVLAELGADMDGDALGKVRRRGRGSEQRQGGEEAAQGLLLASAVGASRQMLLQRIGIAAVEVLL
jgi:hypothetical protein